MSAAAIIYLAMFAIAFYIAADYERLGGVRWAACSIGVSVLFLALVPSLGMLLLSQGILFALLWWVNMQKEAKHRLDMKEREEEMRLDRRERLREAREEIDRARSDEEG